ncbi:MULTISPECIES: hypothetical protein [Streptomyces]|uniref:Type II toxin-antitoxin system HicB family antitoxin n=1 Tax=Streptomyces lonegramiae TaxID=3075524 RepID=A0ABU2XPW6_9ACTN|nr:hypothetical protein [Streptomyces sp. DSM 41529]MDT0547970.1 hypothetical protein [Streptomyces sp. DSM 41529]
MPGHEEHHTRTVSLTVVYSADEDGFNALEPVTGTTSWGKTLAEAKEMISEALELYFQEVTDDELTRALSAVTGAVSVAVSAA